MIYKTFVKLSMLNSKIICKCSILKIQYKIPDKDKIINIMLAEIIKLSF